MECLDNIIVLNKRHLKRTLTRYFDYYHRWRTHLSLNMDAPEHRPVQPLELGEVLRFFRHRQTAATLRAPCVVARSCQSNKTNLSLAIQLRLKLLDLTIPDAWPVLVLASH
jgi:hypothetical protein